MLASAGGLPSPHTGRCHHRMSTRRRVNGVQIRARPARVLRSVPKVRVHPQRDVRARMAHLPRDEHDVQALRDQQRASGASLPAATPEAKARPLAALEWVRVKQPVHHPRRGRRCAPLPTPSNRGDVRALYPLLAFRAVDVAVVRVATRQERRAAPTTRSGAGDLHVRTRDGLMPYRLRVRGVRNFLGVDG
jgi:hypothetical protein